MPLSPFDQHAGDLAAQLLDPAALGHVVEVLRYGDGGMPAHYEAMRGRIMHAKFQGPGVLFFGVRQRRCRANARFGALSHDGRP